MYKRPRPHSRVIVPAARPGGLANQASGLGWEKWHMNAVQTKDVDGAVPSESEPVELQPIDLDAIKAEQQALELEQLREQARAQGHAQGLEAGTEEGRKQGFDAGHKEGLAQAEVIAQKELAEKVAVLDAIISQSHDELSKLQEAVGQSLVHLGVRVAEHVLGHVIKRPAPSTLAIVREVLRQNDEDGQILTVWLHPQDLSAVGEEIMAIPTLSQVRLLPDPALTRGGVKVRTPHGEIDATLQTRWAAAVASIGYKPDAKQE